MAVGEFPALKDVIRQQQVEQHDTERQASIGITRNPTFADAVREIVETLMEYEVIVEKDFQTHKFRIRRRV